MTYNPQSVPYALCDVLELHTRIIIVDNSTVEYQKRIVFNWALLKGYEYIDMDGNRGIAAAQNRGIDAANRMGAVSVVFFDQDSIVDNDAIVGLKTAISSNNKTVFGLVPKDVFGNYIKPLKIFRKYCLMSSGSGCSIKIFNKIGGFEEGLFIDCVDFEWSCRCVQKGYSILYITEGEFIHQLGKARLIVLGLQLKVDSPVRLYYQYRNIIVMMSRDYIPFRWKLVQGCLSLGKAMLLCTVKTDRSVRVSMIKNGLVAGFKNKTGPIA